MKHIKIIIIVMLSGICSKTYSQTSNEAFLKLKKFYNAKLKAEDEIKPIYFNKAEKMINIGSISFPIKDLQIIYDNIDGTDVVSFYCDDCIIKLNENNKLEYWNGFGLAFYNKDDCYEFINLLNNLRDRILISSFSFSQNQKIDNDNVKYFDENYNPISKADYENRKSDNGLLSIKGDSINHKILSIRENQETLQNRKYLDSLLTLSTNIKIDSTKPLVIVYYPGKDPCNSSGSATRKTTRSWYKKMEKGINKIRESNIIYVYKETEGLFGKNDGYKEWIKDPEQTIQRLFFKRHYPCSSFVVISEKGDFISIFGEFSKEYVYKAIEILTDE